MLHVIGTTAAGLSGLASAQRQLVDGAAVIAAPSRLHQELPAGAQLITTREPGGTALGQALRQLLLHPPEEQAPATRAELLLYAADRAQHVQTCLEPALAAGDWVLSDRYCGSTAAYQGYGRGLDLDLINQLEQFTKMLSPQSSLRCRCGHGSMSMLSCILD